MKRINFYALGRIDGKVGAILRSGYTDGCWYYYRLGRHWHAICPFTGVSIATESTRKDCMTNAHSIATLQRYDKALACEHWEKWVDDYNRAVIRARLQERSDA